MRFAARAWGASAALIVAVLLAAGALAPAARAGIWAQVACVNPNGTAATSAGWTTFTTGSSYGVSASSACAPNAPMTASLGDVIPAPVFTSAGLIYTPPVGSTLVGGTLDVVLSADGSGTGAAGDAEIDEPAQTSADARLRCTAGSKTCNGLTTTDYAGTFTVPANVGGDLYVTAGCVGTAGYSCDAGGHDGAWALAQVSAAELLLQNTSKPSARRFSGALLRHTAHGRARLVLDASDPRGPGVYRIAVTIDGRTVHNSTPDLNGGACVPVGTDAVTGALEFDAAQPCPTSVRASFRVPTAGVSDGSHRLQVTVTDAAGNTTTVLKRTILTDNPELTPRPAHGLRARFAISWRWARTVTELRSIAAVALPRSAAVALSCTGPKCPPPATGQASASDLSSLLRGLRGTRFHPGDALLITVTAPHRSAERIQVRIRKGARPKARLLSAGRH